MFFSRTWGYEQDSSSDDEQMEDAELPSQYSYLSTASNLNDHSNVLERSRYIPLRLRYKERKVLRLVEASLMVSEYTDKVDVLKYSKMKIIHHQIKDICAILSGLLVASDYREGQKLIKDKDFKENEDFFRAVFEIARRYKILNPEKMRSSYGKLLHLLMDASDPRIVEILEFELIKDVLSVHTVLDSAGALGVLSDPLIGTATMEIIPDGKRRRTIQKEIKSKESAIEQLARKYSNMNIKAEVVRQCLYSIGDNNCFLRANCESINKLIVLLKHYFDPQVPEEGYDLSIFAGSEGARLSHSHERQYAFVLQSLTLWRNIMNDIYKLWYIAEQDMLSPSNRYKLRDTGQGLNRVQAAPRVWKAMHNLLAQTQKDVGNWVGSSVIHMGDRAVPNALSFIDKYTQVPRIVNPILTCIKEIDRLEQDQGILGYFNTTFKSSLDLKKLILSDFFRHGFDGSGADNFFDAGSCIDGRLTSAWNWCAKIEKKSYYPVFLMSGFIGFDGDFQK
mmetsp:Transcript_24156/g.26823  ORF Transcript_24156/g.26823 Transcript_24156/m.26823 type:complete len:506 (+) Transcript_24156:94-1611(+)